MKMRSRLLYLSRSWLCTLIISLKPCSDRLLAHEILCKLSIIYYIRWGIWTYVDTRSCANKQITCHWRILEKNEILLLVNSNTRKRHEREKDTKRHNDLNYNALLQYAGCRNRLPWEKWRPLEWIRETHVIDGTFLHVHPTSDPEFYRKCPLCYGVKHNSWSVKSMIYKYFI